MCTKQYLRRKESSQMSIATLAEMPFTLSLTEYKRFPTRAVMVGSVGIGGSNPIRVQSMTTTDTMDTPATVAQSICMIEAGCELVRITAPSKKEAENLREIKAALQSAGFYTPLVADIHFTPNAAEIAARIVEKVRVNPGNYADKKKFENLTYTDQTYIDELERIRARFTPLVKICKEYGTAMRIGTNHGSLSDRILSRYGDTPLGMVESAMEFLRICRDHDYHEIVLSMKASNCKVMVQAYRMLMMYMMREGMAYPIHLGVTEAGEGEDGRIKSAVGIGTLLEDGIGDTIRVSLTEAPEAEIPVAQMLVERYARRAVNHSIPEVEQNPIDFFAFSKRETIKILNIGGDEVPRIFGDLSDRENITPASLFAFGYNYSIPLDKWNIGDQAADFIYVGHHNVAFEIPGTLGIVMDAEVWKDSVAKERFYPLFSAAAFAEYGELSDQLNFLHIKDDEVYRSGFLQKLKATRHSVLILETQKPHRAAAFRRAFIELMNANCKVPVILLCNFVNLDRERTQLFASTDFGSPLIDGLGEGLWLKSKVLEPKASNALAFGILQATRSRISKTEYISCPSCGRTLFDLQETTAKIRKRTDHLKGIKIGIMGCIVNGPGEMADADYGYVGTGAGKITLYKEKNVVKRNVASENAVDELIGLIKEYGDWIEPTTD